MTALHLDRDEARRIAIRAQRLDATRETDLLALLKQLTVLQLDPTAAVAPSADLIAYTRLGASYQPAHLQQAIEVDHTMFEHTSQDDPVYPSVAMVRPIDDLALHLPTMALAPRYAKAREWLEANLPFRRDVLDRLRAAGPLLSRDVADTSTVPWPSTGWTNNRNVTMMLEILAARGEVATAGRVGRQRTWDLAERVFPQPPEIIEADEATRIRHERRLQSLGVARAAMVGDAGLPARIDGSKIDWRVDPSALDQPFTGRTALLSPFDRLTHDRVRAQDLFEFEYILEMYKPVDKRRWGYFALPILHNDRMVGKLDAIADRKAGVFRVTAVHEDIPFTASVADAVDSEIDALAGWLGLPVERTR